MWNAALAFDASLHISSPPDGTECQDKIVVHVSTFKESERPASCKGVTLPPANLGEYEVIANPMVKRVTSQPVLWTKVGQWLNSRGLLTAALAGVVCILVGIFLVDPGASKFKVDDTAKHTQKTVDVHKPHTYVLLSHIILFSSALFFVFHRISKELLRFSAGFDSAVIASSCAFCEVALLHEIVRNYHVGNVPLPTTDTILYATRSVLTVIAHFSVSVMDAWMFNVWGKMGVLIPFILCLSIFYVKQRWGMRWSQEQTCEFGECTTWQGVYLSFLQNEIVFGLKLLLPYLRGYSYAVLNFKAIDPERELYKRRRESLKRSQRSQQSHSSEHRQTSALDGTTYGKPSEVFAPCRVIEKSMEDMIQEYKEAVQPEGDTWELDETGQDDECLHQIPRADALYQAGLGKSWNTQLLGDVIRGLAKPCSCQGGVPTKENLLST